MCFSSLELGSVELEVKSPKGAHFPGDIARILSNQSTAAMRALWTPCIQEPAGDWGYFLVDLAGRVLLHGLSDFCRDQTRESNEHFIGATLLAFRSFLLVLIFNIPTRLQCFCFSNSFIEIKFT